jgi:serine/threonine-protein kinase
MPATDPIREVCPPREELLAYCAGELGSQALERVAAHITMCNGCQSSLEQIHDITLQSHPLLEVLRESAATLTESHPFASQASSADEVTISTQGDESNDATRRALAGRTFGQYFLLERIGAGGMGVVYKARQALLRREVAIKMISTGVHASAEERRRFRVEGEAVARLKHPNIIQVHEFNEHDGQLYLCMEYLEGGSLSDRLPSAGLPVREAAELVRTLAGAVHAAHEQDIIHRDLKPGNVLLTADGTPKISDFGLAKLLDAEETLTATDKILGTPNYMAPEQAEGRSKDVGPAADVYALGAILYHALTGRPPFKGANKLETFDQVRRLEPTPPRQMRKIIARDLEAISLQCLAKKPAHRYATAEALQQDLERWLQGKPTQARPLPWYVRAWRRPLTKIAAALLLLGTIAASAVWYRQATAPDPQQALKDIQQALREGKAVELIGATGPPAHYRWVTQDTHSSVSSDPKKPFSVHADDFGLLELLPPHDRSRYRFRAEIHHDGGSQVDGGVGLYFGYSEQPSLQGPLVHCFCAVSFNDIAPAPRRPAGLQGNDLHPALHLVYYKSADQPVKVSQGLGIDALFQHAGVVRPEKWRNLIIDVEPDEIRIAWEGEALRPVKRTGLDGLDFFANHLVTNVSRVQPEPTPRFMPQEALGLFVYRASAWFRSCSVEPLPK